MRSRACNSLLLAIVVGALVGLALPAAADARLVLQQGMAGVRLDMTRAQVRAKLGAPLRIVHGTNEFGAYTDFRYRGPMRVVFQGNAGATGIETTGTRERTLLGVGVGSTEAAVRAKVDGVRCRTDGVRHCFLGRFLPGRRVTDFFIRRGKVTRIVVGYVID